MGYFVLFALIVLTLLAIAKIYNIWNTWWCKSHACLVGKTVIVTGANTGIGYETALDFATRGAKVILACRNQQKAEVARDKIIEETGNDKIIVKIIDFASFDSVRAFAKDINQSEDRLDILVNNAGAISLGDKRTKDGHILLMQVNYFSSFLLTNLLINLLKKSTPSRIVNVSSWAAKFATGFELDKIDTHIPYNVDYHHTKLCNVLFTMELAKKLRGTGITTYSVHPGLVKTDIFNNFPGWSQIFYSIFVNSFGRTCEEGAQTSLYCALEKNIEKWSGDYFADCRREEPFSLMTKDRTLPEKLWKKTEEIVGLGASEKAF